MFTIALDRQDTNNIIQSTLRQIDVNRDVSLLLFFFLLMNDHSTAVLSIYGLIFSYETYFAFMYKASFNKLTYLIYIFP